MMEFQTKTSDTASDLDVKRSAGGNSAPDTRYSSKASSDMAFVDDWAKRGKERRRQ
jgi:hypothetical protein